MELSSTGQQKMPQTACGQKAAGTQLFGKEKKGRSCSQPRALPCRPRQRPGWRLLLLWVPRGKQRFRAGKKKVHHSLPTPPFRTETEGCRAPPAKLALHTRPHLLFHAVRERVWLRGKRSNCGFGGKKAWGEQLDPVRCCPGCSCSSENTQKIAMTNPPALLVVA